MNRHLLAFLLLAPAGARGADYPPFTPGQKDVAFKEAAPLSSGADLKRRFRSRDEPPAYDIAREKFRVFVPKSYRHKDEWGLLVWIDPSPRPDPPPEWGRVLAEKRLLFVAAHKSGNERNTSDRARLAIDAAHNMQKRFHIDPGRVYVAGLSGGGRVASMLGVAYADVFSGAMPIVGANFYKPIPTGEPDKAWLPSYEPEAAILGSAKAKNRYALITGDGDFNRENTSRVCRQGFEAEGFKHVLYLEVPGMGHAPPPADWFAKAIEFLDGKEVPR